VASVKSWRLGVGRVFVLIGVFPLIIFHHGGTHRPIAVRLGSRIKKLGFKKNFIKKLLKRWWVGKLAFAGN
jgi:hypothetical protein